MHAETGRFAKLIQDVQQFLSGVMHCFLGISCGWRSYAGVHRWMADVATCQLLISSQDVIQVHASSTATSLQLRLNAAHSPRERDYFGLFEAQLHALRDARSREHRGIGSWQLVGKPHAISVIHLKLEATVTESTMVTCLCLSMAGTLR
jgi:hypothetical protein